MSPRKPSAASAISCYFPARYGQYRFLVAEQLAAIGSEADILHEPVRRDSGPAIAAWSATAANRRKQDIKRNDVPNEHDDQKQDERRNVDASKLGEGSPAFRLRAFL